MRRCFHGIHLSRISRLLTWIKRFSGNSHKAKSLKNSFKAKSARNSAKDKFPWNTWGEYAGYSPQLKSSVNWHEAKSQENSPEAKSSVHFYHGIHLMRKKKNNLGCFDLFFVSFSYADSTLTLLSVTSEWWKERMEWNSLIYVLHSAPIETVEKNPYSVMQ